MSSPTPVGNSFAADPESLVLAANPRKDLNLNDQFVKSIKQHGVLEPVVVYWDEDNQVFALTIGQRRRAGAIKAGVKTIPAYVCEKPADDPTRATEQYSENKHREPMTSTEENAVFLELEDAGWSALQIAAQTSTKLARVGDGLKVAKTPAAAKALADYQVSIDDALIFAEFENDSEAIDELTETVTENPDQLGHAAQRIRDARADAAARQLVVTEILAAGHILLEEEPAATAELAPVEALFTNPKKYTRLTVEQALAKAGDDLRAYPERGHRSWVDGKYIYGPWKVGYAVANPANHGWELYSSSVSGSSRGPLTDEEKAARALSRTNAPLWMSATTYRIKWVTELLERRNLPAEATALAGLCFSDFVSGYHERAITMAHRLLGLERTSTYNSGTALRDHVIANPLRAPHVLVAVAVSYFESMLDEKKGWDSSWYFLPHYLKQLSAWGYTLSELEEGIVQNHATSEAA